jgi:hypothetical protein
MPVTGGDGPATVVRMARDAAHVGPPGDRLEDLMVATRLSVHVLRGSDTPGVFLHLRLDRSNGDVGAARRALALPALHGAVSAALGSPPLGSPPLASPAAAARGQAPQQPTLVTLAAEPARPRPGVLAPTAVQRTPPTEPLPLTGRNPFARPL